MSTALNSLVPPTDPYGNGVTVSSIPANAVDWIEVQLRSGTGSTIDKKYSFFVDNNGNVLNTDGTIGAKLTGIAKGSKYVAVRHRNHLGAMTASMIDFAAAGPFAFDFSTSTGIYGSNAMRNMGAKWALWAGDANGDNKVIFQGSGNDPGPIANEVASHSTSFTYPVQDVYSNNDINMDGDVIFQGSANDPTPVGNSVSNHPLNTTGSYTFIVNGQLP